jgi:hypothetical protein
MVMRCDGGRPGWVPPKGWPGVQVIPAATRGTFVGRSGHNGCAANATSGCRRGGAAGGAGRSDACYHQWYFWHSHFLSRTASGRR